MAVISGTTVNWALSPRLVTIPVAEDDVSAADLQDTMQDLEDDEAGMVWPKLRNMSGGQDLGGGTTVGFTIEYANAQAVPQRTSSVSTGTITTGSSTQLIDSAADFVTDGVEAGYWIINFTDQSVTEVLEVVDLNTLNVQPLTDGTDNDFDVADAYKVWEVKDFTLSGGNHVAVDTVGASINPVFPTFGRFVTRTSSASATATSQENLEYATFNGGVYWDAIAGKASITESTDGNEQTPLLNLSDVVTQVDDKGFVNIYIVSTSATVTSTPSLDGYILKGRNRAQTTVVFNTADTGDMAIEKCDFSGSMNGALFAKNCEVEDITGVGCTTNQTHFVDCTLVGSITLRADNTRDISIIDCTGDNSGTTLDINGTTGNIAIPRFTGDLTITNMTQNITLGMSSSGGRITIDSSCTAGTIQIFGATELVDNAGVGCTVIDRTTPVLVWENPVEGTYTAEEVMRIMSAALAGKATGLDTNAPVFRDINDTKDRITATTDANGNRSVVTLVET